MDELSVKLISGDPAALMTDVIVVMIGRGADPAPEPIVGGEQLEKPLALSATLSLLGFVGAEGETALLPTGTGVSSPLVLLIGVGRIDRPTRSWHETLRHAAGNAVRALHGSLGRRTSGFTRVLFCGAGASGSLSQNVAALTEGALLGAYRFDDYRHRSRDESPGIEPEILILVPEPDDPEVEADLAHARIVAAQVALARDLVNTPAADLTPAAFAARVADESAGFEVDILDEDALRTGGYGGLIGVGQGSVNPPRLVRIGYRPRLVPEPVRVALIGKGITFDSGGLDLKKNESMAGMYADMAGAAAVYAAVRAAAELELPISVTGWLPLAENMPSGSAIRPSDVLRLYDGTTVEVRSPDAEGRLVLADALARAAEEGPAVVIDIATLTGAHTLATGKGVTAVMSNDDELRATIVASGDETGEFCWPMPLPVDLRPTIDSRIADLKNSGGLPGALAIGGLFLQEFVAEGIRWAHLDIGGAAVADEARGYTPAGATGVGVRTIIRTLESLCADANAGPIAARDV